MPRAYSQDLRDRVLAAAQAGAASYLALAARFQVGESPIRGWMRRARQTGRTTPKPHGGGMPSRTAAVDADTGTPVLVLLVREANAATLAELAARYQARTGQPVSISAVGRGCQRLDLRRKKKVHPGIAGRRGWREAAGQTS